MRLFGFSFGKEPDTADLPLPRARLTRVTAHRRRVEDDIEVAFHRALTTEQLDAAADILALLETWDARRVDEGVLERRVNALDLEVLRAELAGLRKSRAALGLRAYNSAMGVHL